MLRALRIMLAVPILLATGCTDEETSDLTDELSGAAPQAESQAGEERTCERPPQGDGARPPRPQGGQPGKGTPPRPPRRPPPCESDADCTGKACPPDATCTCTAAPDGRKACALACATDADCPAFPGAPPAHCHEGACVPPTPPPAGRPQDRNAPPPAGDVGAQPSTP